MNSNWSNTQNWELSGEKAPRCVPRSYNFVFSATKMLAGSFHPRSKTTQSESLRQCEELKFGIKLTAV